MRFYQLVLLSLFIPLCCGAISEQTFFGKFKTSLESEKNSFKEHPSWNYKIKSYQTLLPQLEQFFNILGDDLNFQGRTRTIFYGMANGYKDLTLLINFLENKISLEIFEELIGQKLKSVDEELSRGLLITGQKQQKYYQKNDESSKISNLNTIINGFITILNDSVIKTNKYNSVNKYFCIGYLLSYRFMVTLNQYLDNSEFLPETVITYLEKNIALAKN